MPASTHAHRTHPVVYRALLLYGATRAYGASVVHVAAQWARARQASEAGRQHESVSSTPPAVSVATSSGPPCGLCGQRWLHAGAASQNPRSQPVLPCLTAHCSPVALQFGPQGSERQCELCGAPRRLPCVQLAVERNTNQERCTVTERDVCASVRTIGALPPTGTATHNVRSAPINPCFWC